MCLSSLTGHGILIEQCRQQGGEPKRKARDGASPTYITKLPRASRAPSGKRCKREADTARLSSLRLLEGQGQQTAAGRDIPAPWLSSQLPTVFSKPCCVMACHRGVSIVGPNAILASLSSAAAMASTAAKLYLTGGEKMMVSGN